MSLPSSGEAEDFVRCFDLNDERTLAKFTEENPILKEQVLLLNQKIANLEKEKEISEKLIMLAEKERDIYKQAFEKEKELTDRALKLADSKKDSTTKVLGGLGLIAIIVTVLASVL